MKIEKITLKEMEIREVDGEYEQHFFNEKTYPIFLTNWSLKRGKELGYIESSLFGELAKLSTMKTATGTNGEIDPSAMSGFDENTALRIIYLAMIGVNKDTDIDYDDFLKLYHDGLEESLLLYGNLIGNLVSSDPKRFAKEFEKVTSKDGKDKKKL